VPTYAYKCKNCEHNFDVQQGFDEDALTVCPKCQGPLVKVFGQVGVAFKGSGFYRNDSAASSGKGSSSSPAKSAD
jgi:putative FmdB family regulatory protein